MARRIGEALQRAGTWSGEVRVAAKSGQPIWCFGSVRSFDHPLFGKVFIAIILDISDRKEQEELTENMKAYVADITKAQDEERKRISRDLHDGTLQSLCLLSIEISALANKLRSPPARELERMRTSIDRIVADLRHYCHELRPEFLDMMGLVPTLRWMASLMTERNRVETAVEVAGKERRLAPETEAALYRIAQEALHNIMKHSRATAAKIRIDFKSRTALLVISDNGRGFTVPRDTKGMVLSGHLGLRGMAERARMIGADLDIRSEPTKGTTVSVRTAI